MKTVTMFLAVWVAFAVLMTLAGLVVAPPDWVGAIGFILALAVAAWDWNRRRSGAAAPQVVREDAGDA